MSAAAASKVQSSLDDWAIRDERMCLSWKQRSECLNRAANALLAAKISPGGRVAVVSSNCAEVALAHVAGFRAGVSTVPVNPKLTVDELIYIFKDADVEMAFADAAAVAALKSVKATLPNLTIVAWRTPASSEIIDWSVWLAAASASEPPSQMPPRRQLIYTSGTTGQPKGVETPPTMFPSADTVAGLFDRFREDQQKGGGLSPSLIVSPMYHTAPLTLIRSFAGGSQLVVLSKFDPEAVLQAIQQFRVQRIGMVPTHFRRLLALPEQTRARYDLSSLKMVTHTGAACPRHIKQAMIDWVGPILRETYGGSESGPTNRISSEEWARKPGSVGRASPPFEVLILDEHHEPLPPGQEGQIFFRDTSGRGIRYYKDPGKTAQAHIAPGVFTLGDVGYCDEEGFLYITDRITDMILSGGVNIYPAESEQRLLAHPDVADVAVIGVPNQDMGEEVRALVIPKDPEHPPAVKLLDAFCRKTLAPYKCPRSYEFVADIGRTPVGKINKRELRRRYWETQRTIGG